MSTNTSRLAAAVATSIVLLSAAHATTTKYDYSVNWSTGELAGTTSQGWFAFDSSLALPNAEYFEPNVLSDFGFTLRGTFHDLSSVQTGFLTFDAQGQLRLIGVGTKCGQGYCASDPGNTNSFYLVYNSQSQLDKFFGVAGDSGWATSYGPGTLELAAVPEPSTLAFLLAGLGLVGVAVRKRGSQETLSN